MAIVSAIYKYMKYNNSWLLILLSIVLPSNIITEEVVIHEIYTVVTRFIKCSVKPT